MIEGLVFSYLVLFTLVKAERRKELFKKSKSNWLLDILGLNIQGLLIPLLGTFLVYQGFKIQFPNFYGIIDIHPVFAFLLNFVVVDYLYYWNHRLFHKNKFWNIHQVHHTAVQMDVFATSRNTLWTSLFFVYLWANSLGIFLLKDPKPFIYSMTLTACLDLWRHSEFLGNHSQLESFLSKYCFLVTPKDHAWHHGSTAEGMNANFAANLNLFDKIHGTFYSPDHRQIKLGHPVKLTFMRKILFPFS